ncbi:hypothetical protein [Mycolicibacterium iranicum]|nr:hypothetical protein [Mycolicibacterium iranicum]
MIVSGVNLDHAWTGLGPRYGSALRDWSRQLLALVVEEANQRGAGILLVAGDLFDRAYVVPATVDYASQVLGTFRGEVHIVPGRSDWIDATSFYTTHDWAPNTSISSFSDYRPCSSAPTVWLSARTSPGGSAPRVPVVAEPHVLIRAGTVDNGDAVVNVPALVHDPREPEGFALLLDSAQPDAPARRIDLPNQPGAMVDVDVTGAMSTDALAAALAAAATPDSPLLLRLMGTLAPGVLLPGFWGSDRDLSSDIVLDFDGLTFATPPVDSSDHSARAEFLHAMAYANTPDLQRHQATALGLAALDDSVQGT